MKQKWNKRIPCAPCEEMERDQSGYVHHRGTAGQERGPAPQEMGSEEGERDEVAPGDLNAEDIAVRSTTLSSGHEDAEENEKINETEYPTYGDEGGGGWDRARIETRKGKSRGRKSSPPKVRDATKNQNRHGSRH